jgi:hypothetical protein
MRAPLFVSLVCCASLATAQTPENQPTSAPASLPALMIQNESTPTSAQCEGCFTPEAVRGEPWRRASLILGGGGLGGLAVSFVGMGIFQDLDNPGMLVSTGLGMASLVGVNASVATLGMARHKQTKKLRPLLLSTAVSGSSIVFQAIVAVLASFEEEFQGDEFTASNDVGESTSAVFAAGALAAMPVSVGLLLKTTKEAVSRGVERAEERNALKPQSEDRGNRASPFLLKTWALGTATSIFLFPTTAEKESGPNAPLGLHSTVGVVTVTSSTAALVWYDLRRFKKEGLPKHPFAVTGALVAQAGLRSAMAVMFDGWSFNDNESRFDDTFENSALVMVSGAVISSVAASFLALNTTTALIKNRVETRRSLNKKGPPSQVR